MTNMQRVKKILLALLMFLCAAVMIYKPELGYYIVALIVSFGVILYGVRKLIYYFTMARHMVGGNSTLYIGLIVTDLGIFILTTVEDPKLFIVIYLLGIHAFSGAISVMRALEARRYGSLSWKWNFLDGILNLLVAILAVITGLFLHSTADLSYLFAGCLLYSACAQLALAMRKTAIVYIQ